MRRIAWLLLLTTLLGGSVSACALHDREDPLPPSEQVVLRVTDQAHLGRQRAAVFGDVPRLSVYRDGKVFASESSVANGAQLSYVRLGPKELKTTLRLVADTEKRFRKIIEEQEDWQRENFEKGIAVGPPRQDVPMVYVRSGSDRGEGLPLAAAEETQEYRVLARHMDSLIEEARKRGMLRPYVSDTASVVLENPSTHPSAPRVPEGVWPLSGPLPEGRKSLLGPYTCVAVSGPDAHKVLAAARDQEQGSLWSLPEGERIVWVRATLPGRSVCVGLY